MNIPSDFCKSVDPQTTSIKFKEDLRTYIEHNYSDPVSLEFGTGQGKTTYILSQCCKHVYTVNIFNNAKAKEINKQHCNITYLQQDLYTKSSLQNILKSISHRIDILYIDAKHNYRSVCQDIEKALQILNFDGIIVCDDYGADDEVYRAVQKYLDSKTLSVVDFIGEPAEHIFAKARNKCLKRSEGIILKRV